ncbi:hypothetical protein G5B40_00650 [Pikeienuella piscinae]|uniref:DUF2029 domain-containing protein n=1 Tax=Pikeienuella piscinae TaxID=2748098 RepID=A0A7L5BSF2_9RHOB|nr:hypothetical protein [Pikeienuella piscinae]QIE54080.1 hypothetical protein G5B40_00650 [Pikeienuella piscinae]
MSNGIRDAGLFVLLGLLCYAALYPAFFTGKTLSHDDVALFETARHFGPGYWIGTGYSEFFEGSDYNFLRPVSQALMWFDHLVFGASYGLYLLPVYLVLGLAAGAAVTLGAELGLGPVARYAVGVVILLGPAWIPPGLLYVTFQQDALAGALSLLAALACLRRRWLIASLLLLVAVFTKEIALFAPLAAALWAVIFARSLRGAALVIAPLVIWAALRVAVFGSLTGGAYAVAGDGLTGLATSLARGLAIFPTGIARAADIKAFATDLLQTGPGAILTHPGAAFAVTLNLLLDALIAWMALWTLTRLVRGRVSDADGLIVVWTLGATGLAMLVAAEMRFAAALHPFLLLLLARLACAPTAFSGVVRPIAAIALTAFVGSLAVADFRNIKRAANEPEPRIFAALQAAVESAPPNANDRLLVIHAPVTGPAPRWLMSHWGRPGEMTYLARIFGCVEGEDAPAPDVAPSAAGRVRVTLTLPDCARFLVFWADDRADLAANGARRALPGGGEIVYEFPDASVSTGPAAGNTPDVEFGPTIVAEFDPKDFTRILILDWATGAYAPFDPAAP